MTQQIHVQCEKYIRDEVRVLQGCHKFASTGISMIRQDSSIPVELRLQL